MQTYEAVFRQKTRLVFDYTVKAAGLRDPAATLPLYAKVAESAEETKRFMDVLAGAVAFKDFFNPANIARLLA